MRTPKSWNSNIRKRFFRYHRSKKQKNRLKTHSMASLKNVDISTFVGILRGLKPQTTKFWFTKTRRDNKSEVLVYQNNVSTNQSRCFRNSCLSTQYDNTNRKQLFIKHRHVFGIVAKCAIALKSPVNPISQPESKSPYTTIPKT